jgi:metal-responsive CopG/Arc/MetJ family transcriptional regulator
MMKIKTSITISEDLINEIDNYLGLSGNRSALIEQALKAFLTAKAHQKREAKDLEILNKRTKTLNEEAADVLSYQVEI